MKYSFKIIVYLFVLTFVSGARAGSYEDFFRAVNRDDARTVATLLQRGFDPNSPDEKGQVGLYLALREGSLKVAEVLLQHPQLKVDATNAADETPLMMAALRGNLEWTQRLLDRGARLNRPGWTPLHYAASGPEVKLLTLLLDRGAAIEATSPNQTTPLMMAARYGPHDAAELLLSRGANARARNDQGLSAADFARAVGRDALAGKLEQAAR
jgi:ankyrin repeat protein